MKKSTIKLLSGVGLSLAYTFSQAAAITDISVSRASGTEHVLQVSFDGPAPTPNSFAMSNPPRIAFDFAATEVKLAKPVLDLDNPLVRSAAAVQAGSRTRLVLSLTRNAAYSAQVSGNKLSIRLNSDPVNTAQAAPPVEQRSRPAPSAKVAAATPSAPQAAAPGSDIAVDFRRGANGEGRIEILLPSSGTSADVKRVRNTVVVELPDLPLPRSQQRKLDVGDFATPVRRIDAFNQGRDGKIVIEPAGDWDFASYQTDRKLVIEVKRLTQEQAAAAKTPDGLGKPVYKGDKLSLNFQNIDVRTVLQVIAEFTGLNIITSDSVSGSITLRLKDVPWDQALDLIMQAKGLDMRRNGNVINIAPRQELLDRDKQILEARKQLEVLEPIRSETFVLRYKSVEEFKQVLDMDSTTGSNGRRQTLLTDRGSALLDPKTNTLIINDTPTVIEKVRSLVDQLDVQQKQVLIEARIVEASDNFQRDLGVKLGFAKVKLNTSIANTVDTAITNRNTLVSNIVNDKSDPFTLGNNVNLPARVANASTIAILTQAAGGILGLELSAMQAEDKGKVISSPRVMTSDRTEATIEEGTEIPYQEATSSGATSISFKKAVLSLKVKPQITPDGNIIMDLQVNKDAPIFGSTLIPAISTKKIQTQVLVENGGTVVIGGIYVQDESEGENKVPLLGDIPVLGYLFKNKQARKNRRELLVFITPKTVDNLSSLASTR
ncbi:type IV pilus secretin PilQ [Crenobacter cavernae]|uniref:Type IV pilus biogenesis and competence protein PilQ n=1 Tax=Crenobacter cavernae TaxID=2290923 RepID=A0A345Y5S9_9NEIS|nr:type IV pilus secretin PilQ [Crenobacter cavernae]AXK39281.1 type IV pilus secretin PilQ [Crenobacter cavernae]